MHCDNAIMGSQMDLQRDIKLAHSGSKHDAVHVRLRKFLAEQMKSMVHVSVCPVYECLKLSQDQEL